MTCGAEKEAGDSDDRVPGFFAPCIEKKFIVTIDITTKACYTLAVINKVTTIFATGF